MPFAQEDLEAVGELLAAGEQHLIGITFEPDDAGWRIGYLRGMGGGDLVSGYLLGDTARSALRPLMDLAERLERNREERGG